MRTALAKAIYFTGALLTHVRTWHHRGRAWLPCSSSIRLIRLAERLDAEHFDHWALIHETCHGVPCHGCGGWIDERTGV
ncbi:hypothetical protein [Streptomyces sp. NPDC093261]|uniref:hypothetical protein n=1 Tax=Streptomyces sp. NPDC093261 TaxID=3366037 RepID=UPI0038071825